MTIQYNNQNIEISEGTTLQQFVVDQVGDKQNGIAVAVNSEVKSKSVWESTFLLPNDDVLIIKATQGG
jgi:sulfur carrier protein